MPVLSKSSPQARPYSLTHVQSGSELPREGLENRPGYRQPRYVAPLQHETYFASLISSPKDRESLQCTFNKESKSNFRFMPPCRQFDMQLAHAHGAVTRAVPTVCAVVVFVSAFRM